MIFLLFQSCLFGVGLVEREITDDYILFANSYLHEMSIWHSPKKGNNSIVVEETVFAIGYNEDFIIAKSHPNNYDNTINKEITQFHIIQIKKSLNHNHKNLTKDEFNSIRNVIGVAKDLDFTIIYTELE